jgi:ubiquinone/menaquinone biosynthesis C-methylase UbiE
MKNRYDDVLREYNQRILELCPYDPFLFRVGAYELAARYQPGYRVLEIGCGEGDSARPMLEHTEATIELLDVSAEMIEACKKRLAGYRKRTSYLCRDALEHLTEAAPYDFIYSAWTVHNFTQADKQKLFAALYANLAPGGTFMLLDKVYPGTRTQELLDRQLARYRYLPKDGARAIIAHEKQDTTDRYRMDEKTVVRQLRTLGFSSVTVLDRVERDVVIVAQK